MRLNIPLLHSWDSAEQQSEPQLSCLAYHAAEDEMSSACNCLAPHSDVRYISGLAGVRDGAGEEAAAKKTRSSYDKVGSPRGFVPGRSEARTVGGLRDAFRPASPRKRRVRFAAP